MKSTIPERLLERLRSEHVCAPGATEEEMDAAETRLELELPESLLQLLRFANGADLWVGGDFPCRLLSTHELSLPHEVVGRSGPGGLVAVLTPGGTSDCVAIQTDRFSSLFGKIVDCSHETFPDELFGVCDSVTEMLRLALNSEGREWIWPAARAYGVDFARR